MRTVKLLLVVATMLFTITSFADDAYISGSGGIYKWNTSGSTVTLLSGSPTGLDSLIFDTSGNVIFSQISTGRVGSFNPNTSVTTFFTPTGNGVADMALDPSGTSFLVADAFSTTIQRVSLVTGNLITTFDLGARPDGLAYDNAGHLFAIRNLNSIVQLDPTSGAILKTLALPGCNTADALTFLGTTGMLYVTCDGTNNFATVDTNLTAATYTALGFSPDGIASNGNNLFFVNRNVGGVEYSLLTNTITQISNPISGADDIAPLSGLGSNTVPEPGSMLLLGSGLATLAALRKRSR